MRNRPILEVLKVTDVPIEYGDAFTAAGVTIRIVRQRTGFGYRRYFLCPSCGRKCGKLHRFREWLCCQRCTPLDLYWVRRGIYDEGGTTLILWHMRKLVALISERPIKFPFTYLDDMLEKPRRMRGETYRNTLLKLQILENMRFATNFHGCRFTAADIRRYTSKPFIDLFELWQVADYQIFGTGITPEYYSFLLDEKTAPARPAGHIGPIHLKLDKVLEILNRPADRPE